MSLLLLFNGPLTLPPPPPPPPEFPYERGGELIARIAGGRDAIRYPFEPGVGEGYDAGAYDEGAYDATTPGTATGVDTITPPGRGKATIH